MESDPFNPETLEQAKDLARRMVQTSIEHGNPCAFEVVRTKSKPFEVQVFGTHALFKSHRLLHVEPIPRS